MTTIIQLMSGHKRAQSLQVKAQTIMIGSLMSNQVALEGPGVEPIHAMLERDDAGSWRLTDLGTLSGVKVNGVRILTETSVKAGDVIEVGSTKFKVGEWKEPVRRVVPTLFGTRAHKSQLREGRLLEVVAYWGNTVLNVDHFAPDLKGFSEVTIGDSTKAHFISGGKEFFDSRVLAEVDEGSCTLKLEQDMQARVRKDGALQTIDGVKRLKLGARDYAHVEHGAVRYFLHYANHPKVELPVSKSADKVLQVLSVFGLLGYFAMVMIALLVKPQPVEVKLEVYDPVPPNDPRRSRLITLEDFKEVPKKVPVRTPDKVKPTKPTVQQKPVVKVQPKPAKSVVQPTFKPTPQKQLALTPQPKATPSANPASTPQPAMNPGGSGGKPAGDPQLAANAGNSGGPGLKPLNMGQLKGTTKVNKPGVEGGTTTAPSLPNLGKLGAGLGQVLSKDGGTPVNFANSAGGTGAKLGSGTKDLGAGGPGRGKTLDYAGNNNLNGWGTGPGGVLGKGGPGNGFGPGPGQGTGTGPGVGPGFGGNHQQATITLAAPPLVSVPSVSPDEIMRVIRANLNQIRHCYNQALQRAPNTAGKMKVAFTIALDGRVASVSVAEPSLDDLIFRACVTGKIKRWLFPRLPSGSQPVQVTYPFVFYPQAAD